MAIQSPALLNQIELSNTVRKLWVDNSQWVRALIYSIFLNIGNRSAIEARLNRVAEEFGTLFSRYYGEETGNKVRANYLRYVLALETMLEAYRDNNVPVILEQRDQLYKTSDELAQLLAHVNRYWDLATLQVLLYELVNDTENEIAHIGTSDFAQEIQAHDQLVDQGYRVADELTSGILRQFWT